MLKIFCFITGDDYSLVKQDTPASKRKISILGSMVLIPVTIWFLIGYSVSHTFLKASAPMSFGMGFFASLVIFILERGILAAGSGKSLAFFRISLGVLIAFLGALFFDEILFKEDIDQQFFLEQKTLISQAKKLTTADMSHEIELARRRADVAYREWMNAIEETKRESDGSGGSGIRGISEITKLKITFSSKLEQDYLTAKARFDELMSLLEVKLNKAEDDIKNNTSGNSILLRIKLLFGLVMSDGLVMTFYLAITAFLFFLEFIVIVMKYSMEETSYEHRIKAQEAVAKKRLSVLLERDEQVYDPYATSPEVIRAKQLLTNASVTLF